MLNCSCIDKCYLSMPQNFSEGILSFFAIPEIKKNCNASGALLTNNFNLKEPYFEKRGFKKYGESQNTVDKKTSKGFLRVLILKKTSEGILRKTTFLKKLRKVF